MVAGLDVLVLVAHAHDKDKKVRLGNDPRILQSPCDLFHGGSLRNGNDLGGTVAVDAQKITPVDDQGTGQQNGHANDDNDHCQCTDDTMLFPLFAGTLGGVGSGAMYRFRTKRLALPFQIFIQRVIFQYRLPGGEHLIRIPPGTVEKNSAVVGLRCRCFRSRLLLCLRCCRRTYRFCRCRPGCRSSGSRFWRFWIPCRCGLRSRLAPGGCRFPQDLIQQLIAVEVFVIHSIPPAKIL